MEIDSASQVKTGFIASGYGSIKALLGKFKSKMVEGAEKTKKIGKDDPRRIIHSAKVGLALTVVSLLYYLRPLYDSFGPSAMWAVLTVVVVFEFTVGGTLSKSMNRGFATFLAGSLGVGADYLASLGGRKGEPVILGILVFVLAAAATFTRFFPHIKRRYDYAVSIFILTFSLVTVSGYRVELLLELAQQRLTTILIGASLCMIISIFIFPAWAGEDLHNLVATNIEKLASFFEGLEGEIFHLTDEENNSIVSKDVKSSLQGYKSVLDTKATEESLANLAWWEPRHGRFGFGHPWKQYLKIGKLIRQCAYHIEALSGCIKYKTDQAASEIGGKIEGPCTEMISEGRKALKEMASTIKTMTYNPSLVETHVRNCKSAMDDLTSVLETLSLVEKADIMKISRAVAFASILMEIIKIIEAISEFVDELSKDAHFQKPLKSSSPEQNQKINILHRGIVKPVNELDGDHVVVTVVGTSQECENSRVRGQQDGIV